MGSFAAHAPHSVNPQYDSDSHEGPIITEYTPASAPSPTSSAPTTYTPVSSQQLQQLAQGADVASVTSMVSLLLQQLPARTQAHLAAMKAMTVQCQKGGHHTAAGAAATVPGVQPPGAADKHLSAGDIADMWGALRDVVAAAAARKRAAMDSFVAHSRGPLGLVADCGPSSATSALDTASDSLQLCVMEAAAALREEIETEVMHLAGDLQRLTETPGWWTQRGLVDAVDSLMDEHVVYTLALRVLLSEAGCTWARARRAAGLKGQGLRTGAGAGSVVDAYSTAGPRHPPGHDSDATACASLLGANTPIVPLLRLAAEDTRAFCIEKNSLAPEVVVAGDEEVGATSADAYIEYVYTEVLKNGMQALIAKWGAWDIDEADPIQVEVAATPAVPTLTPHAKQIVHLTPPKPWAAQQQGAAGAGAHLVTSAADASAGYVHIKITDTGGGIGDAALSRVSHYFATSHKARQQEGYGYSRDHGSQFQGLGVGAPLSAAYARFLGGGMAWEVPPGKGKTTVHVWLPAAGFAF